MRTAGEALATARRYTTCTVGMCLYYVQEWYGAPHVYPDAWSQWANARLKHPGDRNPPAGYPVCYGRPGIHGHIALSTGGGRIRSTDCPGNGQVGETDLDWPTRRWGHPYVGWIGDCGGVTIPGGGGVVVYLSKLHYGQMDSDSVRELQRNLNSHSLSAPGNITLPVTGNYLALTSQVVVADQEQHGFGCDPLEASYVGPRQAAHLGLNAI